MDFVPAVEKTVHYSNGIPAVTRFFVLLPLNWSTGLSTGPPAGKQSAMPVPV